jgi:hypothetical protein
MLTAKNAEERKGFYPKDPKEKGILVLSWFFIAIHFILIFQGRKTKS